MSFNIKEYELLALYVMLKAIKRHKFTGANLLATYRPPGSFQDLDYR